MRIEYSLSVIYDDHSFLFRGLSVITRILLNDDYYFMIMSRTSKIYHLRESTSRGKEYKKWRTASSLSIIKVSKRVIHD